MWADAVFEGGGVKGIGLVGALCVAEEKGYKWKRVAGTSAGSILAALLAAGYSGQELYEIMINKNFADFLAPTWYDYIPFLGPSARLWFKKGLHPTNRLEKWLEQLLAQKGVCTFKDFEKKETRLHIIVSDITLENLLVFPQDLAVYGHDPSHFSVAKAVSMSCSIPFFFEPARLENKEINKTCYLVDGAVLSNYPIWLFDSDNPEWPTFGFRLTSDDPPTGHNIDSPLSMFKALLETMMDAHDNRYIREQDQVRTITVPALDVKLTDFSIDMKKREALFQSGVKAAENFFTKFTFSGYLEMRSKADLADDSRRRRFTG
ncbi:patatin-like phospholipase family protein [Shimazuella sp. AN120528]|uniref:patatin-like phospholipase family protein n=1 Tax=Shimazuella soli TaxID=1892854 RepID=UPI001F0FE1F1|nr:patatin-like phospholipase family protein [Shimazuella soli]MCH5584154.1 patatin-like phospholipase family protein [Shimazuella soli]